MTSRRPQDAIAIERCPRRPTACANAARLLSPVHCVDIVQSALDEVHGLIEARFIRDGLSTLRLLDQLRIKALAVWSNEAAVISFLDGRHPFPRGSN